MFLYPIEIMTKVKTIKIDGEKIRLYSSNVFNPTATTSFLIKD